MKIEFIPIELVDDYERNSNTHPPEQIHQIKASMLHWGITTIPLVRRMGADRYGLIAGHGRREAFAELYAEGKVLSMSDGTPIPAGTIPAIFANDWSDSQIAAYVMADNVIPRNSVFDEAAMSAELKKLESEAFDLELIGFDEGELERLLNDFEPESEYESDADDVPELNEESEPVTKAGMVWLCGEHRVMCGDSTNAEDVDRLMSNRMIDMIFTDPPYGVSYADKNSFLNSFDEGNRIQIEIKNHHLSISDTGKLWASVFKLWSKKLAEHSSYYIASPQGGDLFLMMMMMNENGLPLKHCLIWNKNNHVLGRCDYNYKHEPILFGWANTHKFYGDGAFKTSVWDVPKPLKNDLHPTMKPVALVENAILNSSKKKHIIADMFLGSGTTLIASEKTSRVCYGMELAPNYCDVIIKRWQQFTGKDATLEGDGRTFNEIAGILEAA